jgi:4-hydroxy-tetrahydrodipicolinate synthase
MAGAMKAWDACRPFEELRAADSSADNVSVVKEALAQLGLCLPDVRPPSHRVTDEVRAQIAGILAAWALAGGDPR